MLSELEATAFGCDWLIRKWEAIDRKLEQGLNLPTADRHLAMNLIGFHAVAPGPDGDDEARQLWDLGLAVADQHDPEGPPADEPGAGDLLRSFIAEQLDRLEGLREQAWRSGEAAERDAVAARSREQTPDGKLRGRYEKEAELSFHRNFNALLRLRKRRDEHHERQKRLAKREAPHRESVGGGWSREPGATAAPPGFMRIPLAHRMPSPAPPAAAPPVPADRPIAPPTAQPSPIGPTPPLTPEPAPAAPRSTAAPAAQAPRNEANRDDEITVDEILNIMNLNHLGPKARARIIDERERILSGRPWKSPDDRLVTDRPVASPTLPVSIAPTAGAPAAASSRNEANPAAQPAQADRPNSLPDQPIRQSSSGHTGAAPLRTAAQPGTDPTCFSIIPTTLCVET